MDERQLILVLSNPAAGKEREFNEWYDAVHLPEVVAMPGIVSGQRYEVHERKPDPAAGVVPPPPTHRYLTVYEVDGDLDDTIGGISAAATNGQMTMSDTLDRENAVMTFWTPRGSKREA